IYTRINNLSLPDAPPFSFRVGLRMHLAWGLWSAVTPLLPGQYVLEIKGETAGGFQVDTTYHLTATG
ncbi:hypothetical protein ACIP27_27295, partial [Streptomyces hydrogenans]